MTEHTARGLGRFTRLAALAAAGALSTTASLAAAQPGVPAPAQASSAAAAEIAGAYRVDGLREGVIDGAPVRLVDLTLRNVSPHSTTANGVLAVWWQGRGKGEYARARKRTGGDFGMYDFVKAGETIAVTFAVPARPDVAGVTLEFNTAVTGLKKQVLTWEQLSAAQAR